MAADGQGSINAMDTTSDGLMFSWGRNLPGATQMAEAVDIAEAADVADLAEGKREQASIVHPALPSKLGGPKMKSTSREKEWPPDENLFSRDPEQWLRDVHSTWDETRIQVELLRIYVLRLQEFYDKAVEAHPDLGEAIPIFPSKPPKLLRELGRRQVTWGDLALRQPTTD
jgi:hypothetical protein